MEHGPPKATPTHRLDAEKPETSPRQLASATETAAGNRLLAALPRADYEALAPHLVGVDLALGELIYGAGDAMRHVYFPTGAVVSTLIIMEDGNGLEVNIVGREGLAGLPVIFGIDASPMRTVVQCGGGALRLEAARLRAAFFEHHALQLLLLRYAHATVLMISQSVACNRLHHIEQRLCRWLLAMHDRVGGDQLDITHEFISRMLGVRRAGVTEALNLLQRGGMIDTSRGRVSVLDRPALEAAACECYQAVREEFERLYG